MELIDRDALIKRIGEDADVLKHARELIRLLVVEAPAVDATPAVHGYWIYERFVGMWPAGYPRPNYKCSRCEERHYDDCAPFCPHCGAKMDAESEAEK